MNSYEKLAIKTPTAFSGEKEDALRGIKKIGARIKIQPRF
jgi:hypothetical protein